MLLKWLTPDNKYVDYIMNPPYKNFYEKWKFKKQIKNKLKTLAPSYRDMVLMVEFLYFLDTIFLFENNADINGISGVVKIPKNQIIDSYILTIKVNETQTITITLIDPDKIQIEVHNSGKLRAKIAFSDGCAKIEDKYDELLFIHLNDYLMDSFTKILLKYMV